MLLFIIVVGYGVHCTLLFVCLVVPDEKINELDGSVFHVVGDGLNLGENVVTEHLKNHGCDKTCHSCDECDLDTTCYQRCRNVACLLDGIEGLNHTDHSTHEAEHRGDGDEEVDPGYASFHAAHFYGAVRND